jgi:hypothetical protein
MIPLSKVTTSLGYQATPIKIGCCFWLAGSTVVTPGQIWVHVPNVTRNEWKMSQGTKEKTPPFRQTTFKMKQAQQLCATRRRHETKI